MLAGYYRIEQPTTAKAVTEGVIEGGAAPAPPAPLPAGGVERFLDNVRILIPTEALAAYVSFRGMAAAAADKVLFEAFIAIVFLFVAVILRIAGSRPAGATGFFEGFQPVTVGVCVAAYVSLVYASGGQIIPHPKWPDQALVAQVLAAAIGLVAPVVVPGIVQGKVGK